jgi:hypothetical protein
MHVGESGTESGMILFDGCFCALGMVTDGEDVDVDGFRRVVAEWIG